MVMPSGFSEMALRPLFLELSERLADSDWSLSDWRQYSYQVVISLSYQTAATSIRVRLHYDKKLAVTNVVFLDGSNSEKETISRLLMKPFKPQSETLAEAVEALQERLAAHRFVIVDGAETSYRVQLTLAVENDAVEIQVNADKEGMISSIRVLKASSESIAQQLEKAMAVPS